MIEYSSMQFGQSVHSRKQFVRDPRTRKWHWQASTRRVVSVDFRANSRQRACMGELMGDDKLSPPCSLLGDVKVLDPLPGRSSRLAGRPPDARDWLGIER